MSVPLPLPQERHTQTGRKELENLLRPALVQGKLNHGWILYGPPGAGKATLAYRIARGILDPGAFRSGTGLDTLPDRKDIRLVAAGTHPDLFTASPGSDRKGVFRPKVTVEKIRELTAFFSRTPAQSRGWRVAIIDTADDMTINASNALLAILEEPPENTYLILLSSSPGRLLPTIRSRCRRIALPPLADADIEKLLCTEGYTGNDDDIRLLVKAARGRPGYALYLAAHEGMNAVDLAGQFTQAAIRGESLSRFSDIFSGRGENVQLDIFRAAILDDLGDRVRNGMEGEYFSRKAGALLTAFDAAALAMRQYEQANLDCHVLTHMLEHAIRPPFAAEAE